ncbi:unnamed protein product [Colias eurytheme]|nr:unnamed protein product [Colias eurytheme]
MNGDVEVEASRPRPLSGGIWTLFSWLRRSERSSSSSSESISSVGSDRTAASFDFLSPIHYRLSAPPLILPPNSPTDSYKKRVHERNLRRQQERNITLHRKYGLWREDVGYDAFSLPHKNTSELNSKQSRCRRAASECLQRRAAYVPGKRRAPLPPNIKSVTLPRNYKRKRPAPKPPACLDINNKENQEINNNQLQMNSTSTNSNQSKNFECESGRSKLSKELKVRSEKSFLKQIFDNKKRHSAIETSHIKLLPSISELDKQAAEIIETNKMLHNLKNNVNDDNNTEIQQNFLPGGNMWICTKCLRKYNVTIKSCVYCVPKHNKLNDLVPAGTQTDLKQRQGFNISLNENEEKKKLKEMLKEMKDSLPKKSKERKIITNLNIMESNQSSEAPTLRIGSSIEDSVMRQNQFKIEGQPLLRTSDVIRIQRQSINDNPITKETALGIINKTESINIHPRTNDYMKNDIQNKTKNENGPKPITSSSINVTNENIEKRVTKKEMDFHANVGSRPILNQDKLLGQPNIENVQTKNIVLNSNLSTNLSIHTPLKISSLLNPIYLPKNKTPQESSTSSVQNEQNVPKPSDPIKQSDPNLLKASEPNQSTTTASTPPSTSRCRLDPEIVSQIIKKSMEDKQKSKQEKICKKEITPKFDHTEKRDLINQLELSIAKGDEKAAAEAAAKLAKLRLSCSVLSYSSQIVAGPSTSNTVFANETEENLEFKNRNAKHKSQENTKVLNDSASKGSINHEIKSTENRDSSKKEESCVTNHNNENLTNNKTPVNDIDKVLIEIWIEDKVAARGPVQLNILRNSTVADLKEEAEKAFGLAVRLQRWIVGKTLCTDDTVAIISLAGPQFTAPFYLCLVEAEEIKKEPVDEKERDKPEPNIFEIKNKSGEFYTELIKLEQQALVSNTETFECGVCMEECAIGNGAVLRECIHSFCRECLSDSVRHCEEPVVPCPAIGCPGILQDREIRALLSEDDYEKWLARGLAAAESGTRNTFHCRTTDCSGWAFCEPGVRKFPCPVCKHNNCVQCQAVHEGESCEEYQKKLRETVTAAENSNTDEGTQALLTSLISRGEALECPECSAIITKKWGCDWVKCSACKTEICWITKGRRWGPAGRGDTSGGCRCGIDGKRCHPSCGYCH